jgi:glutamate--cysteine ligase catalytic subunit
MGLLSKGSPLDWEEAQKHADLVRRQGILQFLHIYRQVKDRQRDSLAWGDEVEYMLLHFHHQERSCRLALRAAEVLDQLQAEEHSQESSGQPVETSWKPEYARYMLEATPGRPFGSSLKDLLCVEANMRLR